MKAPSRPATHYTTKRGLLNAVERAYKSGADRIAHMSRGMWLYAAEWQAEQLGCIAEFREFQETLTVTRRQDLKGGDSLFGIELPKRAYIVGDNIPKLGRIDDMVETAHGLQYLIRGTGWINARCIAA